MWAIISRLIEGGFEVIAFDAIGNGDSDGNESSMLHFAETLSEASVHFGPFHGVVGHSIGASAIPFALTKDLRTSKVVMISARDDLQHFLTRFLELIEADQSHFEPVRQIWDQVIGWDRIMAANPSRLAATLELPGLIIHDRQDEDVPFADSERIHAAWKNSQLHLTDSLGHVRIVRSKEVAQLIAEFM